MTLQLSASVSAWTPVRQCDLRKTLDQVHDFELVEWFDEAFAAFESSMLWFHGEIQSGQYDRVDSRNRCDIHLGRLRSPRTEVLRGSNACVS